MLAYRPWLTIYTHGPAHSFVSGIVVVKPQTQRSTTYVSNGERNYVCHLYMVDAQMMTLLETEL